MLHKSLMKKPVDSRAASQELGLLLWQTAWGEELIQPALVHLRDMVDDSRIRRMLESQLRDEERHEQLYCDLIKAWVPEVAHKVMPTHYRAFLDLLLAQQDPQALIYLMHVCLECFALGAFDYRAEVIKEPSFASWEAEIRADELRHVGFGPLILQYLGQNSRRRSHQLELVRLAHSHFHPDHVYLLLKEWLGQDLERDQDQWKLYQATSDRYWRHALKDALRAEVSL